MKSLVLASGGPEKEDVLLGALRTGLVDVLISDETTMRAVLSRQRTDTPGTPV